MILCCVHAPLLKLTTCSLRTFFLTQTHFLENNCLNSLACSHKCPASALNLFVMQDELPYGLCFYMLWVATLIGLLYLLEYSPTLEYNIIPWKYFSKVLFLGFFLNRTTFCAEKVHFLRDFLIEPHPKTHFEIYNPMVIPERIRYYKLVLNLLILVLQ